MIFKKSLETNSRVYINYDKEKKPLCHINKLTNAFKMKLKYQNEKKNNNHFNLQIEQRQNVGQLKTKQWTRIKEEKNGKILLV